MRSLDSNRRVGLVQAQLLEKTEDDVHVVDDEEGENMVSHISFSKVQDVCSDVKSSPSGKCLDWFIYCCPTKLINIPRYPLKRTDRN